MVTSMKDVPGSFTMYDVYTGPPFDCVADGYLDPPKIPRGTSSRLGTMSTPSGNTQAGYSFEYIYSGELVTSLYYSDMFSVLYSYDGLGRISNITKSGTTTYYPRFWYYKNDELMGIQYGNGLKGNYTYDKLARVSQLKLTNNGTILLLLNYGYANTGVVTSVWGNSTTISPQTLITVNEKYTYDPLYRLTNSTVKTGGATSSLWYQYDSVGNRLFQSVNNTLTTYYYDPVTSELKSITTHGNTASYGYDLDGNLVAYNSTSTSHWTYAWDVPGNLLKVANDAGVQGYYAYDGLGRRLEAKEGSSTIFYAYHGPETFYELSGSTSTDYLSAGNLKIGKVSGSTVSYYHMDALGSTRLVTSASKAVVFSDGYQPFGQDNGTPGGTETYRFTGKPVSQTTGLYHDYHRWYDPGIGRFISQDPVGGDISNPQSLDRYVYVNNIPTTFTDLTGLLAVIAPVRPSCPTIFQDFWGSLRCSILGPAPVAGVTGGGVGGGLGGGAGGGPGIGAVDPTPAGAIIVGILWGYWLYSNWDHLFGNRDTRPTLPDGSNGNGGGTTGVGCPRCSGLLGGGGFTANPGTSFIDMARGDGNLSPSAGSNAWRIPKMMRKFPVIGKVCTGTALFAAVGLWIGEDLQSSPEDRPDAKDVFFSVLLPCLAIGTGAALVAASM